MTGNLQPLDRFTQIVNPDGTPTLYFTQWAQQRQIDIGEGISEQQALELLQKYLEDHQIQAGTGIDISPTGDLSDSPTISAKVQEILDQITSTQGSVLFRGSTGWAPLAPGTAGQFLKTNGAGTDPEWAAGGGGGGGKYFSGATGSLETVGTGTYATKGLCFTPLEDVTITELAAYIDPNAGGDLYALTIASLKNVTLSTANIITAFQVDTVLETSASVALNSTDMRLLRRALSPPVVLTAGVTYIVAAIITSGTGSTVCRVGYAAAGGAQGWDFNGPFNCHWGYFGFNTVGLSPNQTFNDSTTGKLRLFLSGTA